MCGGRDELGVYYQKIQNYCMFVFFTMLMRMTGTKNLLVGLREPSCCSSGPTRTDMWVCMDELVRTPGISGEVITTESIFRSSRNLFPEAVFGSVFDLVLLLMRYFRRRIWLVIHIYFHSWFTPRNKTASVMVCCPAFTVCEPLLGTEHIYLYLENPPCPRPITNDNLSR